VQIRERRILQENQKQVCASKLPPNPEKRINTIFDQFSNRLARLNQLLLATSPAQSPLFFQRKAFLTIMNVCEVGGVWKIMAGVRFLGQSGDVSHN